VFKKSLRIVSLLPSATEIVCALGAQKQLVGRSHECDFPEAIRSLPVCTKAKISPEGTSAQIDREVKTRLADALALYEVDTELLRRLEPDVILTQAQCEVCAVSLEEVERALVGRLEKPAKIVSLSPQTLNDVWASFLTVAEALGIPDQGKATVKTLKTRAVDIIEKTCVMTRRPSVGCIEWIEPLMAAGNWVPELVELAGGKNLFGEAGKHSPWLEWKQFCARDPEVIVVMPCGFDVERTRQEVAALTKLPEWSKLQAVKQQRVYLTDGNQYFNRPGPRLVDSLEILAEIIHPDTFTARHKGKGWQPL
jgi:iron complex transport system substrate-binding protein